MVKKPKRPRTVERVRDLEGGEVVRLDAGVFRVTHRPPWAGGARVGIPLDAELREMRGRVDLAGDTRVLEVLARCTDTATIGLEVDPLRGGGR